MKAIVCKECGTAREYGRASASRYLKKNDNAMRRLYIASARKREQERRIPENDYVAKVEWSKTQHPLEGLAGRKQDLLDPVA